MEIRSMPDVLQTNAKGTLGLMDSHWMRQLAFQWEKALTGQIKNITLDISDIEYVTLFEWVTVVSILERIISKQALLNSINIDIVGSRDIEILSPHQYLLYQTHEVTVPLTTREIYKISNRIYRVSGFIESLGTLDILKRPDRPGKDVLYPGLTKEAARLRSFYTTKGGHTVVLGLTRIDNKECSGLEKLDSRLSQNYSSEIGDHHEKESQLPTATKSSGRSASLERNEKRGPSLSRLEY